MSHMIKVYAAIPLQRECINKVVIFSNRTYGI